MDKGKKTGDVKAKAEGVVGKMVTDKTKKKMKKALKSVDPKIKTEKNDQKDEKKNETKTVSTSASSSSAAPNVDDGPKLSRKQRRALLFGKTSSDADAAWKKKREEEAKTKKETKNKTKKELASKTVSDAAKADPAPSKTADTPTPVSVPDGPQLPKTKVVKGLVGASSNWKSLIQSGAIKTGTKRPRTDPDVPEVVKAPEELVEPLKKKQRTVETIIAKKIRLAEAEGISEADRTGPTKYMSLACHVVNLSTEKKLLSLAQVVIVNSYGHVVYNSYVKQTEKVTDYRTKWTGLQPKDFVGASAFKKVQLDVDNLIKNRTIIGHDLKNAFRALMLTHPHIDIRDTAHYSGLSQGDKKVRHLRDLVRFHLEILPESPHDLVEEARLAILLYEKCKVEWEKSLLWAKAKVKTALKKKKQLQVRQKEIRATVDREFAQSKKKAADGSDSEDESFYNMIDPALELEED